MCVPVEVYDREMKLEQVIESTPRWEPKVGRELCEHGNGGHCKPCEDDAREEWELDNIWGIG